jgi:hypothetical protein
MLGGVNIIHGRLLQLLAPHLDEHVLGQVYKSDGSLMKEYSSIYFRDFIRLRGDGSTTYPICRECRFIGTISDAPYVLRRDLAKLSVFHDELGQLFVSEALARKLPWRRLRDLEPFPIAVRDKPLPDDPLAGVERALHKLNVAFSGDTNAAFREIEDQGGRLNLPDGPQQIGVEIRKVELTARVWSTRGLVRVESVSAD